MNKIFVYITMKDINTTSESASFKIIFYQFQQLKQNKKIEEKYNQINCDIV
jgi:hypothetical protein